MKSENEVMGMEMSTAEKGKVGELYASQKVIENGGMPFLPLVDIRGVDAVVRKKDGTYVEIQVKSTWPPEQAGYFNVPDLEVRDNFYIVCLIAGAPPLTWIIPSKVFAANTTKRRLLGLGFGTTKHEKSLREKLVNYLEAWHLITG